MFGFIEYLFCFCSALVSGAEVALFSLSQQDIDETVQGHVSKGKIIADLIDRPKSFWRRYLWLITLSILSSNFVFIYW
jgi:CBS domain containing-hemolysin-like protein